MKILAIETSLAACSAAFMDGNTLLAHRFEVIGRGHGEILIPMIEDARTQARVEFSELNAIAVCIGPGTFTGVRVGVATARALSLASHVPIRGFVSLEIVAAGAAEFGVVPASHGVTAVFDARRGEVYHQSFSSDLVALTSPALNTLEEAAQLTPRDPGVLVGTGASLIRPHLIAIDKPWSVSNAPDQPDARVLARLALGALTDETPNLARDLDEPLRPLYIRSPDAKLPRKLALDLANSKYNTRLR